MSAAEVAIAKLEARVAVLEATTPYGIQNAIASLDSRIAVLSGHSSRTERALGERVASLESCMAEPAAPFITKAEPVDGKPLRKTCLHDNGDGSFRLTLLVDVRGEDIVEAADLLKRGRALQAAADYKGAPGDEPDDILMCGGCGAFGNVSTGDMANVSRRYTKDRVVTDATCQKCWRTSGMASLP